MSTILQVLQIKLSEYITNRIINLVKVPEDVIGLIFHDHLVVTRRSLPLMRNLSLTWSRSIGAQGRSASLMLMSDEVCFILHALSLLPIARGFFYTNPLDVVGSCIS